MTFGQSLAGDYLTIDPSFSNTGLVFFSLIDKKIIFDLIQTEVGFNRGFNGCYHAANGMTDNLIQMFEDLDIYPCQIISEIPPPTAMMNAALFALDAIMLYRLIHLDYVDRVDVVQPFYLNSLHGKRSVSTSEHRVLFNELRSYFPSQFTWKIRETPKTKKETITSHEMDAFFFLCRLLVRNHSDLPWVEAIAERVPKFTEQKEKSLGEV